MFLLLMHYQDELPLRLQAGILFFAGLAGGILCTEQLVCFVHRNEEYVRHIKLGRTHIHLIASLISSVFLLMSSGVHLFVGPEYTQTLFTHVLFELPSLLSGVLSMICAIVFLADIFSSVVMAHGFRLR